MALAVVRLRGRVGTPSDVEYTFKLLRLNRLNHCVFLPDNPVFRGMISKIKDYVAYGPVSPQMICKLLQLRGRIHGNKKLTQEWIQQNTKFSSIQELAQAISKGEIMLKDLPGMSPVLRLHPPRKGHAGIKHHTSQGGELGYHDLESMEKLLWKMR